MASGALSGTIAFLVNQVAEETIFQYDLLDRISELKMELDKTQKFLENAEQKQRGERRIMQWVYDVRDISYSLEDEFEKYSLVMEKLRHPNSVLRYAYIFEYLVTRHQLGTSIDRLLREIEGISRSLSAYGIKDLGESSRTNESETENLVLLQQRRLNAWEENFSFVGLQNDLKTLKERLLDTKEKRTCCISVVGMGGLGKTTIARKVYKDVKTHFEFSTWVYISKEFNIKNILEKISRDIPWPDEEKDEIMKDEEKLGPKINEFLQNKRYLVVLDDVWNNRLWEKLRSVFPEYNNGSRLLLTTRNEDVARDVDPLTPLHILRLLNKDESWELFCQKAFLIPGEDPNGLLDLGKRITDKCGGLPLAIVVLGGLLSGKRKQDDSWEEVSKCISPVLDDSQQQCKDILAMSYDDLPIHMKPCFLYFGLFPEHTEIPAKKLIQFWIAEDLVQEGPGKMLEDIAEKYLEELIARSLVQVTKREHGGGAKLCRIHYLLRDLAIEESRRDNFLHIRGPEAVEGSANVRRLSIQSGVPQGTEGFNQCTNRLRSLFIMSYIYIGKVKELIPKMQSLRILDMPNFPLAEFPEEINQLIHLRYLGLRFDKSLDTLQNLKYRFPSIFPNCCFEFINPCVDFFGRTRLPPTPSNLKYLQTLNFSDSYVEMSHSIWTLRQLRHLYGKHLSIVEDAGDQRIDGLKNLQTLHLRGGNWINNGLENLWNLRDLRIHGDLSKYHEGLYEALKKLLYLRVLELSTSTRDKIPKLPSLSHLIHLKKMVLSGPMESLPRIDEFPPSLVTLKLLNSKLQREFDPFATLQSLKELKYLKLRREEDEVNEINVFSGGFPKLELLELELRTGNKIKVFPNGFPKLEILKLEFSKEDKFYVSSGAFPKLEELTLVAPEEDTLHLEEGSLSSIKRLIMLSPKLKYIPDALKSMYFLEELKLSDISIELFNRVQQGGEDWHKIQHVSNIYVDPPSDYRFF